MHILWVGGQRCTETAGDHEAPISPSDGLWSLLAMVGVWPVCGTAQFYSVGHPWWWRMEVPRVDVDPRRRTTGAMRRRAPAGCWRCTLTTAETDVGAVTAGDKNSTTLRMQSMTYACVPAEDDDAAAAAGTSAVTFGVERADGDAADAARLVRVPAWWSRYRRHMSTSAPPRTST